MQAKPCRILVLATLLSGLMVAATSVAHSAEATGWCISNLESAQEKLTAAEVEHGTNSYLVVPELMAFADACVDIEDFTMASIAYSRAATLQKQRFTDVNHDLLERLSVRIIALNRLGQCYLKLHKSDLAEKAFTHAMSNAQLVLVPESEQVKIARTGLVLAKGYFMHFEEAADLYDKLLASVEDSLGKAHPEAARVIEAQAWLYKSMGDLSAAEKAARKLSKLRREIMPPNHPATARALTMEASVLYERGKVKDVIPILEEALAIRKAAFGPRHSKTAMTLNSLAEVYRESGNAAKAAEYEAATGAILNRK